MFDTQFLPTFGPLTARPIAAGKVFYVASGGDDGDNGISPDTPLASITVALGLCLNDRNDYIIVMDNCSANEAAFPISVNKSRVHILGMSNNAYPYARILPTSVNSAFEIGSVQHYEIAGFELGGGDNTVACINSIPGLATAGRAWIHHCSFAVLLGVLACNDGIHIENTFDWAMSVVEDCLFCGSSVSDGIARDGIRIEGNSTRGIFRRNIFRTVQGVGIHCMQNGSDIGEISDNHFSTADLVVGEAITMENGVGIGGTVVCGNRAGYGAEAPNFVPYRDRQGAAANIVNAWIDNLDTTPGALANVVVDWS